MVINLVPFLVLAGIAFLGLLYAGLWFLMSKTSDPGRRNVLRASCKALLAIGAGLLIYLAVSFLA